MNTTTKEISNTNIIKNKEQQQLKRNVFKNYWYHLSTSFNTISGIWMIYMFAKGYSLFEIGLVEAIFHITSMIGEVPTGAVADLYGRKTSRILGRIMYAISLLLMIFATNIWFFALSFMVMALSLNLESGAGDALIYDSLKEIGEEKTYMKLSGRMEVIYQIGSVAGLVIGGFLGKISYTYAFISALFITIVSLSITFTFKEPSIGKVEVKGSKRETFIHQLRTSYKVAMKDKRIRQFILVGESFAALVTTVFFYIQNHMKIQGFDEFHIGLWLGVASIGGAVVTAQVFRLEKRFGLVKTLVGLGIVGCIGFVMIALSTYIVFPMMLVVILESGIYVVLGDYLNRMIPSEHRATILSFQGMCFSFFMIFIFPIVGFIGDRLSLQVGFRLVAITAIILLGIMFKILRNGSYGELENRESEEAITVTEGGTL